MDYSYQEGELSRYWYHVAATSGTTKLLHMVPQMCYSGTTRVILSAKRKKKSENVIFLANYCPKM